MPINEGFHPARPLPLVSDDQIEPQEIENARDRTVALSRVLKVSVLIAAATAAAIAVAALSAGDPATPNADVTASLAANSKLQPDTDQSTSTISIDRRCDGFGAIYRGASGLAAGRKGRFDPRGKHSVRTGREGSGRKQCADIRSSFQAISGLGGGARCAAKLQAACSRRPGTGREKGGGECAGSKSAQPKAPLCPARPECTGGGARGDCPQETPAGAECSGSAAAGGSGANTEPVRAGRPGVVVPASLRPAQLEINASAMASVRLLR